MPRYGESIIRVPVTVSAATVLRQFFRVAGDALQGDPAVPYTIRARVGGGWFGPRSFTTNGTLRLSY